MNKILEVTGYPNADLISQVNEDAKNYLERIPNRNPRVNFTNYFAQIQTPSGKLRIKISFMANSDLN